MHYNGIPSLSNRLLQAPSAIWIVTTSFLSHNWSINWQTVRVRAKLSLGFIAQTVSQPPWYVTCIGWSHPLWFFSPQLESWSFPSTENMYHANKYIFHHIIHHETVGMVNTALKSLILTCVRTVPFLNMKNTLYYIFLFHVLNKLAHWPEPFRLCINNSTNWKTTHPIWVVLPGLHWPSICNRSVVMSFTALHFLKSPLKSSIIIADMYIVMRLDRL